MSVRLAHLTDLHLFQDREQRLAGMRTWDTFERVMDLVDGQAGAPDFLILTGDIAQDEALDTYRMLRERLGHHLPRCRLVPGNHDNRDRLREVFPELFAAPHEYLTFSLSAGGWQIIGLDSQVPGEVGGHVDNAQIAWLDAEIRAARDRPVILFIHHPPVPINVHWLDVIGLDESAGLVNLIHSTPRIRVVCAGHVHQEFAGYIGTTPLYTTPSSCVQFSARAEREFDTRMAGYRLIELDAQGYRTRVERIQASGPAGA